jgi:hypothetical protein
MSDGDATAAALAALTPQVKALVAEIHAISREVEAAAIEVRQIRLMWESQWMVDHAEPA